jgi:probable rRNA maturation factor
MVKEKTRKIRFNYLEQSFHLPERTKLKAFILDLFKKEGVPVEEVNYIFCSDDYLLQINQDFLKHNTYTDIVTFQYTPQGEPVHSDIYVSIDRIRENAAGFMLPFLLELYRVIFHGALHICGYEDKTEGDMKLMRAKEDQYLRMYVPRGTH